MVDERNEEDYKQEVSTGFTLTSTVVVNGCLVARGLDQDGERCRSFCRMTQECFKLLVDLVVWVSGKCDVGGMD